MRSLFILFLILFAAGCAQVQEFPKIMWGSSTRALEEARVDALRKTYTCSFDECYEAVLQLDRQVSVAGKVDVEHKMVTNEPKPVEDKAVVVDTGFFDVFLKDRVKGVVVVMGIVGNVDTTEIGIFFTRTSTDTTTIEISSLSSSAKRKVAEAVFKKLEEKFKPVEGSK